MTNIKNTYLSNWADLALKDFKLYLQSIQIPEELIIYEDDIRELYCCIFGISILHQRPEVKDIFDTEEFNDFFSNILESFYMLSQGNIKCSALITRIALEDIVKFLADFLDHKIDVNSFKNNKKTIESKISNPTIRIGKKIEEEDTQIILNALTSYQALFNITSQITHSMKYKLANYKSYEKFRSKNIELFKVFLNEYKKFILISNNLFIIVCRFSFNSWTTETLKELLDLLTTETNSNHWLNRIKNTSLDRNVDTFCIEEIYTNEFSQSLI